MTASESPFQFIGVSPFVDRAAEALSLADDRLKGKAKSIEHLGRIQTALGQAAQASVESRQAIFDQALAFRNSLAVALLAAELAIADVARALGLDAPSFNSDAGQTPAPQQGSLSLSLGAGLPSDQGPEQRPPLQRGDTGGFFRPGSGEGRRQNDDRGLTLPARQDGKPPAPLQAHVHQPRPAAAAPASRTAPKIPSSQS